MIHPRPVCALPCPCAPDSRLSTLQRLALNLNKIFLPSLSIPFADVCMGTRTCTVTIRDEGELVRAGS